MLRPMLLAATLALAGCRTPRPEPAAAALLAQQPTGPHVTFFRHVVEVDGQVVGKVIVIFIPQR